MAFYQRRSEQFFNQPIDVIWDFISNPKSLKDLTPNQMGFEVVSKDLPNTVYPGMIITYKVSPLLGIKNTWVTEITQVEPKRFYVDEQRVGPYKIWHHQHFLKEQDGGTLMTDIVSYQPPFGLIGRLANRLIIDRKLQEIMEYRQRVMREVFYAQ